MGYFVIPMAHTGIVEEMEMDHLMAKSFRFGKDPVKLQRLEFLATALINGNSVRETSCMVLENLRSRSNGWWPLT